MHCSAVRTKRLETMRARLRRIVKRPQPPWYRRLLHR
jgi:hypothetical protein